MKMDDIAVIIVTYNPDPSNLVKLITQLGNISIYVSDNGSRNFEELKSLLSNYSNICLIDNKENKGIAYAQNQAIAETKNSNFLFFLDQDSYIEKKTLLRLRSDFLNNKNCGIGILAAVPQNEIGNNEGIEFVDEVISSGMLIPTKIFNKTGGMLESLFIDMVDYELCWRFKKYHYKVAKDFNCSFVHQLGHNEKVLGKLVVSPVRLYYVFRNTIYLIKSKRTIGYGNSIYLIYKLCKQFIFNVFFCSNRMLRLRYILLGIRDVKISKMGKINYEEK